MAEQQRAQTAVCASAVQFIVQVARHHVLVKSIMDLKMQHDDLLRQRTATSFLLT